jgi:putative oxidoreductase
MNGFAVNAETFSIGLLVARVAIGLLMAAHGAQKLWGWFGGYGLRSTGEFMVQLGFRQGSLFAAAAGATEVIGGLLVASGLLGPIGPALIIAVMTVAMITVHWSHGVFATKNGVELPLMYALASIVFAVVGYGAYSLDAVLGFANPWPPELTWPILGAGLLGGVANTTLRRQGEA